MYFQMFNLNFPLFVWIMRFHYYLCAPLELTTAWIHIKSWEIFLKLDKMKLCVAAACINLVWLHFRWSVHNWIMEISDESDGIALYLVTITQSNKKISIIIWINNETQVSWHAIELNHVWNDNNRLIKQVFVINRIEAYDRYLIATRTSYPFANTHIYAVCAVRKWELAKSASVPNLMLM